jgi:hypothetical protein
MGGIGTLPMDYGQSLQVPQQPQSMFTPTGSATSSPLLNYGQSQLGQAGGTPLTMRSGGITRLGYQEGGMGMTQLGAPQEEPIFPRLETLNQNLGQAEQTLGTPSNNQFNMSPMTSAFTGRSQMNLGGRIGYQEGGMDQMQDPMMQQPMQPQQMMEPPLQGMEGQQPDIKDPQQALDIIIQMLIAQGIPPEQAREIALQMVQAVAEGGMGEMEDQRIEARFGGRIGYAEGGIGSLVDREQYGFGSIFKGAAKAVSGVVKGVTSAVKSVASSPIGKAALTAAAIYFGGPMLASATQGTAAGNFLFGAGVPGMDAMSAGSLGIFGQGGMFAPMSGSLLSPVANIFSGGGGGGMGIGNLISKFGTNALISGAAGALGGALAGGIPQQEPGESDADYQNKVNQYKLLYQQGVSNPQLSITNSPMNLYPNNPFYAQRRADGGRIGYQEGGIGDLVKQTTQQSFFGTPMMAMGGRMGYAMGAEVPTRENQAGVKELDYRDTGGFVPPIGIKERADDIPAMLSNNEFVFTADAVRNAGGGDENIGAQRMYKLMKNLEAGGSV